MASRALAAVAEPRRYLVALAAATASVLVGGVAVVEPVAALGLVVVAAFVLVSFRNLAAGVALFTVLIAVEDIPTLQSGFTLVKLAGGVLVLAWLNDVALRRSPMQLLVRDRPVVAGVAAGLVVWSLGSSIWAQSSDTAISSALRLSQGIVLVFVVYSALREPRHLRWLLTAYVGGMFAASAFALADAGGGRFSGSNTNPNELAAAFLPAIMICAFAYLGEQRALARWVISLAGSMLLVALLMTGSRGGLVGLAAGLLAAVALAGHVRFKVVAATLVVLGIGVAYYVTYAPPDYVERLASVRQDGGTGRSDLWRVAIEITRDEPVTGVGLGNFPVVEPRYATGVIDIARIDLVLDEAKVVHNLYLGILAELGLIGLVLFAGLILTALTSAFVALRLLRAADWQVQLLVRGFTAGLLALLAAYTFSTAEYEKQLWLLLGAALALPALAARAHGREDGAAGPRYRDG